MTRYCQVCSRALAHAGTVRVVGYHHTQPGERLPLFACECHFANPTAHLAVTEPAAKESWIARVPEKPSEPWPHCYLCVGKGFSGDSVCRLCDGDGKRREDCATCKGRGQVLGETRGFLGIFPGGRGPVTCSACGGRGSDLSKRVCDRNEKPAKPPKMGAAP